MTYSSLADGFALHGVGGSAVESLASGVRRLALLDARTVPRFLAEIVLDPYKVERGQAHWIVQPTRVTEAINGATRATQVIADRFLLLGAPLHEGTLLRWDEALEFGGAFRSRRAWCPNCLAEGGDRAYDQLAWCFTLSESCGVHQLRLVDSCGRCHQGHRPWHVGANPWSCPHCGALLEQTPSARRLGEFDALIPALLAATPVSIDAERMAAGFGWLVRRAGGLRTLGAKVSHSPAGLSAVCSGAARPKLAVVLRALVLSGESLCDFLSHERAGAVRTVRQPNRPRSRGVPRLRRDLVAALQATPVSLRSFSAKQRMDARTVRAAFPDLAARLVARRRLAESARRAAAAVTRREDVASAFRSRSSPRAPATRREVEQLLGKPGIFRAPEARAAFAAGLAEFTNGRPG